MQETPERIQYLDFMNWFQNKYPKLYVQYWQSIVMSVNGNGIRVDGGNTSAGIKQLLSGILAKYQFEKNK